MLHIETPDWAERHNYKHHSNPRSKDRAKNIFEKSVVRPKVYWAKEKLKDPDQIEHHEKAQNILDTFTKGRGSAAMRGGISVQDACNLHLIPDETGTTLTLVEAIHVAQDRMRKYEPKDWNATVREDDTARKEHYIDEIAKVTEHAVMGLREAMKKDNRFIGEIQCLDTLPGNALPHNTLPDYGRRGDLKTKWSTPHHNAKDPLTTKWRKASLPSSLSGMFDMNNVYQVAGFYALNGRQPPFLVYANAYDYKNFTEDNAPELKPNYLEEVIRDIAMHHKTTENLLRAANSTHELCDLCDPDFNQIYWKEPPAYVAEAKKLWGLEV